MRPRMFFLNLAKVYSFYWASIPDARKRWNWLIFSGLIIGGTLGIIAAIILKKPLDVLIKAISVLILGLILMCLLHNYPKS